MTTLGACASSSQPETTISGWRCQGCLIPVSVHTTSPGLISLSTTTTTARPVGGHHYLLGSISTHYPTIARKARVYGKIVVDFRVDEYGVVTDVNVEREKSIGARVEERVEQILMGTVFEPATLDNQPVASRLRLPLEFELYGLRIPKRPENTVSVNTSFCFSPVILITEPPQELAQASHRPYVGR